MSPNKARLLLLPVLLLLWGLYLFRTRLGYNEHFAVYDITVVDTLKRSYAGDLTFGSHRFMAGSFHGHAVNVGVSVVIPDTAIQSFGGVAEWDSKYDSTAPDGTVYYTGPYIPDPPARLTKIPVLSRLPARKPWEKYHFIFTYFPNDSVNMKIDVLRRGDCSHIKVEYATAILGSGPCSW